MLPELTRVNYKQMSAQMPIARGNPDVNCRRLWSSRRTTYRSPVDFVDKADAKIEPVEAVRRFDGELRGADAADQRHFVSADTKQRGRR